MELSACTGIDRENQRQIVQTLEQLKPAQSAKQQRYSEMIDGQSIRFRQTSSIMIFLLLPGNLRVEIDTHEKIDQLLFHDQLNPTVRL